MLTFREDTHEYRWNGKIVPSVTQILGGLYSFAGVPIEVLEAARERGTDVHRACQFYDEGDLDEDSLTDDVRGYLAGWKAFLRDCAPVFGEIEQPVYHPTMGFAGTPDRNDVEFLYQGERLQGAQIDIKTALETHPCFGVQTAAYSNACGRPKQRRFTVQLRNAPRGVYRIVEWKDPSDWAVFVALLTIRTFKTRNYL